MGRPLGLDLHHNRAWFPATLIALVAVLSVWDSSATRVYIWPWFPLLQAVCLFPLIHLLWRRAGAARFGTFNDPVSAGVAIFALVSFVSAVHSEYRCLSIPFSAPYLFFAASYFCILNWMGGETEQRASRITLLSRLLGAFIALVILTSFAQWWLIDLIPALKNGVSLESTFRNGHPFGHSNYTAGFTALTFPWLVALAWKGRRLERLFWSAMVVLGIALIASTGSRGGVAGLVLALTCFGGITFWKAQISRRASFSILFGLTLVAVAVAWHEPRLRSLLLNRRWDNIASESNRQREAMAEGGWLIGRAHSILGIGPGTVPYVYPRFRAQLSGGVENVLQVHNTYLEIWAEMGALGTVSILLVALGFVQASLRIAREIQTSGIQEDFIFPLASLVGLVAYATFALTDHQLDVIAIAMVLSVYLAFLRGPSAAALARAPSKASIWVEAAAVIFIGLTVILFSWPNARARQLFAAALDAWYAHDQNLFLQLGHKAAETAPWDTAYLNEIAGLISENSAKSGSPAETFLAEELKACFQQSLRQDPSQEYPHFSLGWIALKEGDPSALTHLQAAAQLVPDKGGVYLGRALALLNQNRISEVSTSLALEALNDPSFLTSAWWTLPDFKGLEDDTRQKLNEFYSVLSREHPGQREKITYNQQLSNWLLGDPAAKPGQATNDALKREFFSAHPSPQYILATNSIVYKNQRVGLPVLVRHADFPAPHDVYEVQENSLVYQQLKFLFPSKGWLPTFELAAFARSASASPNHAGPQK